MNSIVRVGIFLLLMNAVACGGRMPKELGPIDGRLHPCPDSPNCVSSFATDERHRIEPLQIVGPTAAAWQGLVTLLEQGPRIEIVTDEGHYLHAVFTSLIMRYRDDVEFLLIPERNVIAVRSASRVGYGDMGANRARVEAIRRTLAERGFVRAADREKD
jgi:uncharacterized protein (DUF1499 family)